MKTAILFGSTGLVGSFILAHLLDNPNYQHLILVVRNPVEFSHPKCKIIVSDYRNLVLHADELIANDVYISLGTTKKKTPSQATYFQIDHDYPLLAAKLCREKGATKVSLVSSVGANAHSTVFYLRTKGLLEEEVTKLNYPSCSLFRPSMILGDRKEIRTLEKWAQRLSKFINPLLIGPLHIYKGISATKLALAMINANQKPYDSLHIYQGNEIINLTQANQKNELL